MTYANYQINTVPQFKTTLNTILNTEITDDELVWIVCLHEAEKLPGKERTYLAKLIKNGIPARTIDNVQEYLDFIHKKQYYIPAILERMRWLYHNYPQIS